jgi:hypothetical protein
MLEGLTFSTTGMTARPGLRQITPQFEVTNNTDGEVRFKGAHLIVAGRRFEGKIGNVGVDRLGTIPKAQTGVIVVQWNFGRDVTTVLDEESRLDFNVEANGTLKTITILYRRI